MKWAAALLAAVALLAAGAAVLPATASAQTARPKSLDVPPENHRLTGNQVLAIAKRNETVRKEREKYPGSTLEVFTLGPARWQVSVFSRHRKKEIAQLSIDDASGAVLEEWTGFRVPWTMARGYDGAFGRKVTALYVWIPLLIAFLVPFFDWRRPFRLLHFDLLVLASLSISLAFFVNGDIEQSVPLAYPPLLYVLGRMLWIGLRPAQRAEMPRMLLSPQWLAVGLVFLLSFRIGLNITNSNVIDVGFSGVLGADRIMDGDPLYGGWPTNNEHGDTYGPVNYLAYIPFEQALPWSGSWDDLPAAHAASIAFDLLTVGALLLLGRRIGGAKLGLALAYAWAAWPFTLFTLNCNANDALVSFLLVVTLLLAGRPLLRGASAALAGLTKFGPLALAPLLATHGGWRPRRFVLFSIGFLAVALAALLPFVAGDPGLFYDRTLGFQAGRDAPFSIWGLWDIEWAAGIMQGIAIVLAVATAFWPTRRPDLVGTAALCAAVLVAVQLSLTYWFYLYVVWFFPLVMLALLAPGRPRDAGPPRSPQPVAVAQTPEPALP